MTKIAYVFPGQGSQAKGMLAELAQTNDIIQTTFAEASEELGYDLWTIAQEGPDEKLNDTRITQPLLLTASVALFRLAQEKELSQPQVMAGHSLGEYSALTCAGVLEFQDAVLK